MNKKSKEEILDLLDHERQTISYPGASRIRDGNVIRDVSADANRCDIVYSSCSETELDEAINQEMQMARSAGYELEWKVYGHDRPACLGERLAAAGFEAGDREAFMVFSAGSEFPNVAGENTSSPTPLLLKERGVRRAASAFGDVGFCDGTGDIRRVMGREDLADVQLILEEVAGKSCDKQIQEYSDTLENHPDNMSMYIAYVDGEPAAIGRVYFHESSKFAYLYGGNTRVRYRNSGLFTQLVATRIREAVSRGVAYVCVDALPTSEPILRKRGFEALTYTQPFCFNGAGETP